MPNRGFLLKPMGEGEATELMGESSGKKGGAKPLQQSIFVELVIATL